MSTTTRPIYLKQFLYEEAQRQHVSPAAIQARMKRGQYAGQIQIERKSSRDIRVIRLTTPTTRTATS